MLLIITPAQYLSALTPLKTHKDQTGILTTIITLEDVFADYTQGDQAERIKRCIAEYQQKQGIRYVLLVGDADMFPVRYTKTDRAVPEAFNTAFYVTDLYYAALYRQNGSFDDWDANNNGYYGELNGESHSGPINIDQVNLEPIVAVGRIPASTLDEVTRYVQKAIRYELHAYNAGWAKNALLLATHEPILNACKTQVRIANDYLKDYSSSVLSSTGSPCASAGSLTAAAITQKINSGVGLVGYMGHGNSGSLALPGGGWGIGNIPQLTNVNCPTIVAAFACQTAQFATEPPYDSYVDINNVQHQGTRHGEVFNTPPPQPACLQNWVDPDQDLATHLTVEATDAGAVAYLGGVTGMQYSEPMEYFIQGVPKSSTVGEAWQFMVRRYYQVKGLPGTLVNRIGQP